MLVRVKQIVALWVVMLVASVILLPLVSLAATSPTVSVLSPLTRGLRAPVKIALDAEGNTYVADQRVGGIVKYNAYGVQQLTIRTAAAPNGLVFAQDGTLLVSQASSVVRYNVATGQEVGRLSDGQLQLPVGIAVDDVTGYVYVADSRANQVVVFTASGAYVKAFAQGVTADANGSTVINPLGKLSMPTGISFEKVSRQIAVADTLSSRVQFFDVEGNFVKSIGNVIPGGTTTIYSGQIVPMQFVAPVAIAFEYSKAQVPVLSRMYVLDSFQANVQVVDPATPSALTVAGTTQNYIGSSGISNGQLMGPSDAIFDAVNNRLMVVNGFGNITIYGIDGGKNPVDITPPTLSIDPVPATVSIPNITISGTVEAGAAVTVATGATTVAGSVIFTSATTWKSDITGLVAGNNAISVTARDAAGNTTPAQSVNIAYLLSATVISVSSSVPSLTNVRDLVLSGTVDDGATVTVTNDSTSVSGTATVVGGSWTYRVTLAEGTNSITITAQKSLSLNATAVVAITLDSTPPALTVSALSDGSYTSNQVQNVTGNASDTGSVTVLVNNMPTTLVNGSFSVPVSLVTGTNSITVVAGDAAGNVTVNSRTLYFDATKPLITIAAPMDNSYTNNAALHINGAVDKVATITVAGAPAVVDGSNNWSADMELVAGLNTIEVVATDLYGNSSTLKRSITLDTIKPILAISSPVQDVAVNQSSATIAGTVSDADAITLTYSLNGKITPVPVDAGNFTFKVDFVTEGIYPVIITATDLAGNSTTATRSLIYDVTPPTLSIDPVIATVFVPGVAISGTVEAGATVTVATDTTTVAGSVVYTSATTWKSDITGLVAGNNTISVTARDAAGNTAPVQSVNVTYLVPAPAMGVASVPSLTNVRDFVLNGSVDDGATVTVTNDSTSVSGTATVIGSSWTYRVTLAESTNSITITAQKPLSLKATAVVAITLDSIPPALTVSALSDGSYTSNQVQNLTGNASDTSSVTVLVNNMPTTLVNGSFSIPVSLVTGTNTITVAASDVAGNVTVNSRTLYFDATKPLITIAAPMDNSFINNTGLHINGRVDKVATITVAGVPAVVDGSNNWSADISLVAGLNTLEVVATDLYGNSSTLKRSTTLDTIKPILAITSPVQDVAVNQSSATITGTVSDADAITLTYSLNGKITPVPVDAGNFTFMVDFVTEGIYPVIITATDLAGNSTTAIRSLIYDVTPPVLTLDAVKWQAHALGGIVSGTVDPGSTVAVKEGSSTIGTVIVDGGKWSADLSGISYNQTLLGVVATDAAGNSTSKMLKTNAN